MLRIRIVMWLALVTCAVTAKAASLSWTGTTGNWSDPNNWGGTEPQYYDDVSIDNGGTAYVMQSGETCMSLFLGLNDGNSGAVQMTDGTFSASSACIGYSGVGTFTQTGGTSTVFNLLLGYGSASCGTYFLSGTGQISAVYEWIGYNAATSGLFQQSGGTNTTNYLSIGTNGQYIFTGGTLQITGGLDNQGTIDFNGSLSEMIFTANTIVNLAQPGSLLQNTQAASLIIGANSLLIVPSGFDPTRVFAHYSNAGVTHTRGTTLSIPGGQTISGTGNIDDPVECQGTIAVSSKGFLNLNNGLLLSGASSVTLGDNSSLQVEDSASGISGGTLSVGKEYIGNTGSGKFTQTAGINGVSSSLFTLPTLFLGYTTNGKGTYELGGTGKLSARLEFIGYSGTGTFTHTTGNNTVSYYSESCLYLGFNSGAIGTYDLIGTGKLTAGKEYVGYSGSGIFTQTDGTNSTGNLYLGYNAGASGTYNLNGGMLIVPRIIQGLGTATFNFGGGTLRPSGGLSTSMPMTLTGIGGDANVDTYGRLVTLSGILSGPGGLVKRGTNTLTLSAANSYLGSTTITAGTLALANTGTLDGSSVIDVGSGATFDVSPLGGGFSLSSSQTLRGSGKILGNLTINGIHAPGNSPGIETVQGNYTMLGKLQMELMGTTAGTDYDQVLLPVNGSTQYNATLGGSLLLDWTGMSGSSDKTQLWILRNDSSGTLSGKFSNYSNGALLGNYDGRNWFIYYGADATSGNLTGGNDVAITAVPEPSTLALLALGGIGLIAWAWRRKK